MKIRLINYSLALIQIIVLLVIYDTPLLNQPYKYETSTYTMRIMRLKTISYLLFLSC